MRAAAEALVIVRPSRACIRACLGNGRFKARVRSLHGWPRARLVGPTRFCKLHKHKWRVS